MRGSDGAHVIRTGRQVAEIALIETGRRTGTVRHDQILERTFMGQPRMNPELPLLEKPTNEQYVMAAQIRGKLKTETLQMSDEEAKVADEAKPEDDAAKKAGEAEAEQAEAQPKAEEKKADDKKADEEKADEKK